MPAPLRRTALLTVGLALMAIACQAASGAESTPVDLILKNAKIWTGDEKKPQAEALAVFQGRILFVGSTADVESRFTSPVTIDAQGRRVVPGFHDSHVHVLGAGLGLA